MCKAAVDYALLRSVFWQYEHAEPIIDGVINALGIRNLIQTESVARCLLDDCVWILPDTRWLVVSVKENAGEWEIRTLLDGRRLHLVCKYKRPRAYLLTEVGWSIAKALLRIPNTIAMADKGEEQKQRTRNGKRRKSIPSNTGRADARHIAIANKIGDKQLTMLKTLVRLGAFSREKRISIPVLAKQCGGRSDKADSYRHDSAKLNQARLTKSVGGNGGGIWLTKLGSLVAKAQPK